MRLEIRAPGFATESGHRDLLFDKGKRAFQMWLQKHMFTGICPQDAGHWTGETQSAFPG
jgi:hypothetical protein